MKNLAIAAAVVISAMAFCFGVRAQAVPDSNRPQVIVRIIADDLGMRGLDLDQGPDIPMPQLRELARMGTSFTDANSTSPICVPSRTAMILGRYPQRRGTAIWTNPPLHGQFYPLPRRLTTMAEALGQAGYRSIALGKYPVEKTPAQAPTANGYDEFLGIYRNGTPYRDPKLWRDGQQYPTRFKGNITEILASEAVAFLRRHRGQRLFVDLTPTAPHLPYQGDASQMARCVGISDLHRRGFCTTLVGLDDLVGRVRGELAAQGLLGSSLIVFAGDNGCEAGCDGGIWRGKKGTPYEGGTRVPLVVSWPGHVQAGATYKQAVSLMDIYPTLLDAVGRPALATRGLDGVSLLPALHGSPVLPHRELFFSTRPDQASIKSGGWKLYQFKGRYQLYDLRSDLGEQRDLARVRPDVVAALVPRIRSWLAGMQPRR
mgnify:CR=1 FL=1